jgi:hypothetical protein
MVRLLVGLLPVPEQGLVFVQVPFPVWSPVQAARRQSLDSLGKFLRD